MKTDTVSQATALQDTAAERGIKLVTLSEDEYVRLLQKADESDTPLPEPDINGNFPAEVVR